MRQPETREYGGENMVQKPFLALTVLGAFLVIAAGVAQDGWGHSYETTQPGESMSNSETFTAGENWISSDSCCEGMVSSEYESEAAVETGRLPEEERFEADLIFGDEVERNLRDGSLTGGP
jgi:hypothetical protein